MKSITIGTRGSRLAIAQARAVIAGLRLAFPRRDFEIRVIRTTGDRQPRTPLHMMGSVGVFVKEIEEQLRHGNCDIAVHSLKDLPLAQPDGLTVTAVTGRLTPFDALITRDGSMLTGLEPGDRVGTSSARRAAMLLAARPELRAVPMRGNVDTRLKKLREGACEALIVAAAGLERLGMKGYWAELLTPPGFLPSPGQGCLALEVRSDDTEAREITLAVHHPPSAACVTAEREFLRRLGGGCRSAVGACGDITADERLRLHGCVLSADGTRVVRGEAEGDPADPEGLGTALAGTLLASGAREILDVFSIQ